MSTLNPYLSFKSNAKEAMEFYQSVFGGDLKTMGFDPNMPGVTEADAELIMHSQLDTDSGFTLMGADTPEHMGSEPGPNGSVSLSGSASTDEAELTGYWEQLSDGATILAPFEVAPWGDRFGMCIDKFGVTWLVNITSEQQGEQA